MTTEATPAQPASADVKQPGPTPRELLERLHEISPAFRECRPLALRIDKAVMERFPDVDKKVVRTAMRLHTGSTRYLKALEKATHRYDLDGNPDAELTDEHRAHAAQTLKERFAEVGKRKREQQKADAERQRVEQAEQRKAEKLQQLVQKFGSR
jgi:ProP effector